MLQEMRAAEENLLAGRQVQERERGRLLQLSAAALLAIVFGFSLFTVMNLRREYRLRRSAEFERARLTDIVEATPDIVSISDLSGRVHYMNPAGRKSLGLLGPLDGVNVSSIKPAWAYKKIETEAIPTALKSGSWTGEAAFLTPSGQEIPVSQVVIAHHTPQGVSLSTVARDISLAKEAEHAAADVARFEMIHGKALTLFNSTMDRRELLQGTLDILAEDQAFPVSAFYLYDEWSGVLRCEAGWGLPGGLEREIPVGEGMIGQAALENRNITVDGLAEDQILVLDAGALGIRPRSVLLVPIAYQDHRQGVLLVLSPRTLSAREDSFLSRLARQIGVALHNLKLFDDMKLLAEQLRVRGEEILSKNTQLKEADRMKSEFLANMSHELRTPLNSIIGFSEVLADGLRGELAPGQKQYVEEILDSGRHLLSLINDILDLSKVEAGRMELELEHLDVDELLGNALSVVKEKAAANRVDLDWTPSGLGGFRADGRKVKQIVYNLLSNAVKFTSEGGAVRLSVREVRRAEADRKLPAGIRSPLPGGPASRFLEISVADTGIGIPADDLGKLFQPFVQLESSLSRLHQGTGLGLAMVRKLAELHGGAAGVQSEEGRGSTFYVWLPFVEAQAGESAAVEAPSPEPEGSRVLVVESDSQAAQALMEHLSREGMQCRLALTYREAETLAREFHPQAMLLDVQLAEGDGWEFLARLKSVPELARIPVVIASFDPDQEKGMALGAAMVLQKPVLPHDLSESLEILGLRGSCSTQACTVLVVDDDPKAVEIISSHLLANDFQVERAYGGEEAVAMARRLPLDLVVLDLMMPGVSGFDVVEALKARPETEAIPVLVLTSKQLSREDRSHLSGQVVRIMEKSEFQPAFFVSELRKVLVSHRRGAPPVRE